MVLGLNQIIFGPFLEVHTALLWQPHGRQCGLTQAATLYFPPSFSVFIL